MLTHTLGAQTESKTLHFQWAELPVRNPGVEHLHRLEYRGIVNPFIYSLNDTQIDLPKLLSQNTDTPFIFVYTEQHEVKLGVENPFCLRFLEHCDDDLSDYLKQSLDKMINELIEEELSGTLETSPTKGHLWRILKQHAQTKDEIKSLIKQIIQRNSALYSADIALLKAFSDKSCRVALTHALTFGHPSVIDASNPKNKAARLGGELIYDAQNNYWILENRSGRYSRELSGSFKIDHNANTQYLLAVAQQLKAKGIDRIQCKLFVKDKVRSAQGKIANPDKDKIAFLNRCIEYYVQANFELMPMLEQITRNELQLSLDFQKENRVRGADHHCEISLHSEHELIRALSIKFPIQSAVLATFIEIHGALSMQHEPSKHKLSGTL